MSYRGGLGICLRVGALAWLGFVALGCSGDDDSTGSNPKDSNKDAGDGTTDQGGKGGTSGTDQGATGKPDGGGQAGQGGAGGKGTSGAGGSNATPDAGNSGGINCVTVQNPCKKAGKSCDGDTLVTCANDANGCLVEAYTNCNRGSTDFCDPSTSPPSCAMDPCAGLANACTVVGTTCAANGTDLVKCAQNADGCLVKTTTNCTKHAADNVCSDHAGANKAECVFDKCSKDNGTPKANVCVENVSMCAQDVLVKCVKDADGCPIAKRTNCADPGEPSVNYCKDGATPACAFDPCIGVTNCLTAGKTCDSVNLVDCEPNGDGCLVQTVTDCTQNKTVMQTCNPAGTPQCAACTNAPGCTSEGQKTCTGTNSDTLSTCTDTDGDGCLNVVVQNCGPTFACDTDAGCVYDGGDQCKGPNNADDDHGIRQVLAPGSSAGPFMTTDAGKDFSAYSCPGPFGNTTVPGQSQDVLFALDVPANTVALITITDVAGFATNNAPWLVLLTRCANGTATAEASCLSASRTNVTYVNEANTPVRVYVSVDASQLTGGGDNVGTFSLNVDSRPIKCGDGLRDGSEACDDGNIFEHDGCTPNCELEDNYVCTSANPSVCTLRPTDPVCANVMCPALPSDVPNGTATCCTTEQTCGVAYAPVYGAGCVERNNAGAADTECPNANGPFSILAGGALTGCCRTADHKCGLLAADGGGCTERTEVWRDMQDGYGQYLYTGPFLAISCTP